MVKSNKLTLSAEKRKVFGRKVKSLRKQGSLPANIYGKKIKSEAVVIARTDFESVFKKAGETSIIELNLGKIKKPVLINNVQTDPVTDQPLHVDFLQVDLKEKVKADVPIKLTGAAPAEKEGKGILVQQLNEVEVEALPMDLPSEIEVAVSHLAEVDEAIYVKDLKFDRDKVVLVGVEPDQIVVSIVAQKEEKEEELPAPVAVEEGEVKEEVADQEAEGEPQSKPEEDSSK